jgi:hypothetical protein
MLSLCQCNDDGPGHFHMVVEDMEAILILTDHLVMLGSLTDTFLA